MIWAKAAESSSMLSVRGREVRREGWNEISISVVNLKMEK